MTLSTFLVATDLSFSNFDSPKAGLTLIRNVRSEVVRLAKVDARLLGVTSNINRRDRTVEIVLQVRAESEVEAAEVGIASLRASIHAAGGCTAHWEGNAVLLAPTPSAGSMVPSGSDPAASPPRWRRRRDDVASAPIRHRQDPSWFGSAARAAKISRPATPLPSLDDVQEPIDLR